MIRNTRVILLVYIVNNDHVEFHRVKDNVLNVEMERRDEYL